MTPYSHHSDFRHAALFYSGDAAFVDDLVPFIQDGLESEEPVLVMVPGRKTDLLREGLGSDAEAVHFTDMARLGANPARIIPAWREFVTSRSAPGSRVRGIGEPIWPERTADEVVECQHHETLLNVAFNDATRMDLVCPYDAATLGCDVIDEALRTHPDVLDGGSFRRCVGYRGVKAGGAPLSTPLPDAPGNAPALHFEVSTLDAVRGFVAVCAAQAGLSRARRDDLVIAVNELASNSVKHGGGRGTVRAWVDELSFLTEVRDRGRINRPLAGRESPQDGQVGGQGLWLANQLCDLLQIRTFPSGSVVRAHMHR